MTVVSPFSFYNQYSDSESLPFFDQGTIIDWFNVLIGYYQQPVERMEYIFCTDDYLLELNKQHLDHDYLTDILTFPYNYTPIEADIFISIDRLLDNAQTLGVSSESEFLRLLAHGFLHMCGYKDKSEKDQAIMREEEDRCIQLFENKHE